MASWKRWTPEEDAFVRECVAARILATKIAPLLGRSVQAVQWRKHFLGLKLPQLPKPPVEPCKDPRIADIQAAAADLCEIPVDKMRSGDRTKQVAQDRMLAMFIAKRHTRHTYSRIGQLFGDRDHSTVIHAVREIEKRISNDAETARKYHDIVAALGVVA